VTKRHATEIFLELGCDTAGIEQILFHLALLPMLMGKELSVRKRQKLEMKERISW